jgi:hypothetical protein
MGRSEALGGVATWLDMVDRLDRESVDDSSVRPANHLSRRGTVTRLTGRRRLGVVRTRRRCARGALQAVGRRLPTVWTSPAGRQSTCLVSWTVSLHCALLHGDAHPWFSLDRMNALVVLLEALRFREQRRPRASGSVRLAPDRRCSCGGQRLCARGPVVTIRCHAHYGSPQFSRPSSAPWLIGVPVRRGDCLGSYERPRSP